MDSDDINSIVEKYRDSLKRGYSFKHLLRNGVGLDVSMDAPNAQDRKIRIEPQRGEYTRLEGLALAALLCEAAKLIDALELEVVSMGKSVK